MSNRNRAISICSSRSKRSGYNNKAEKLNKSQTFDISEELRNIGRVNEEEKVEY